MGLIKNRIKKSVKNSTDVAIKETATTYIDLAQYVADTKAVPLLWGEGWDLVGEDSFAKQRVLGILNNNGIDGLFKTAEQNLSMRLEGNQLFVVQPGIDGSVLINIADMKATTYQGDQNGHLESARVVSHMQVGMISFQIVQTFNNGWMKTVINKLSTAGLFDSAVSVNEYNKITGNKLLTTWEYGDTIPLIMFTNRSSAGLTDQGDAYAVRNLQELLDTTMSIANNETITNTTKILTKHIPGNINKNTINGMGANNAFIQTDGGVDGINILHADPKIAAYWESINNIKNTYMESAPYSTEADFNGTQTQVGVLFQGKKDIETTRIKNAARTEQVNALLELIIAIDAMVNADIYANTEFEIQINSFNVLETADKDVKFDKMMALGIVTQRDVIAHYYDTKDEEQITEIIERLNTEGSFNSPSTNNELDDEDKDIDNGGEE